MVAGGTELGSGRVVESAVVGFAEDLGRILGTAQKKAEDWLNQRQAVAEQLAEIRDTAARYLEQLTEGRVGVLRQTRRGRRGRPPGATNTAKAVSSADGGMVSSGRKAGRRKMTAAQRKAVGERMRKYWAARRKAEGTK